MFAAIAVFLRAAILPLATKLLVGLGVGIISYAGLSIVFSGIESQMLSYLSGVSSDIYSILAMGGIITAIKIVASSYGAAALIVGFKKTMGVLT